MVEFESLLDGYEFRKALDMKQTLNKQLIKTFSTRSYSQVDPSRIQSSCTNLSGVKTEKDLASTLISNGVNQALTHNI